MFNNREDKPVNNKSTWNQLTGNTKILLINWIIYNSPIIYDFHWTFFWFWFSDNEKPTVRTYTPVLLSSHQISIYKTTAENFRSPKRNNEKIVFFAKLLGRFLFLYSFYTPQKKRKISTDNKSNILWIIQTNEDIWEAKFNDECYQWMCIRYCMP